MKNRIYRGTNQGIKDDYHGPVDSGYDPVVCPPFRFANSYLTTKRTDVYNLTLNIVSK